ncbi:hypothetical protein D3P09_02360 [Paenibacillus pinisoli]|uniref:Uncharacterized protein n=1 Tax=Paenibacillus pinisoli TaxID=1276110 RepID=A0A3A6PI51_9BACL|nr:hypothetical protein D3P09_02360 [Paenibacillus pinisoli]
MNIIEIIINVSTIDSMYKSELFKTEGSIHELNNAIPASIIAMKLNMLLIILDVKESSLLYFTFNFSFLNTSGGSWLNSVNNSSISLNNFFCILFEMPRLKHLNIFDLIFKCVNHSKIIIMKQAKNEIIIVKYKINSPFCKNSESYFSYRQRWQVARTYRGFECEIFKISESTPILLIKLIEMGIELHKAGLF